MYREKSGGSAAGHTGHGRGEYSALRDRQTDRQADRYKI
jgi:hypothetical protein